MADDYAERRYLRREKVLARETAEIERLKIFAAKMFPLESWEGDHPQNTPISGPTDAPAAFEALPSLMMADAPLTTGGSATKKSIAERLQFDHLTTVLLFLGPRSACDFLSTCKQLLVHKLHPVVWTLLLERDMTQQQGISNRAFREVALSVGLGVDPQDDTLQSQVYKMLYPYRTFPLQGVYAINRASVHETDAQPRGGLARIVLNDLGRLVVQIVEDAADVDILQVYGYHHTLTRCPGCSMCEGSVASDAEMPIVYREGLLGIHVGSVSEGETSFLPLVPVKKGALLDHPLYAVFYPLLEEEIQCDYCDVAIVQDWGFAYWRFDEHLEGKNGPKGMDCQWLRIRNCGHNYHTSCLMDWISSGDGDESNTGCPCCEDHSTSTSASAAPLCHVDLTEKTPLSCCLSLGPDDSQNENVLRRLDLPRSRPQSRPRPSPSPQTALSPAVIPTCNAASLLAASARDKPSLSALEPQSNDEQLALVQVPTTPSESLLRLDKTLLSGIYGGHGREILQLSVRPFGADPSKRVWLLQADKIVGDPNVPAGHFSFRAFLTLTLGEHEGGAVGGCCCARATEEVPDIASHIRSLPPDNTSTNILRSRLADIDTIIAGEFTQGQINRHPGTWWPELEVCQVVVYRPGCDVVLSVLWLGPFHHITDFRAYDRVLPEGQGQGQGQGEAGFEFGWRVQSGDI